MNFAQVVTGFTGQYSILRRSSADGGERHGPRNLYG